MNATSEVSSIEPVSTVGYRTTAGISAAAFTYYAFAIPFVAA